MERTFDEHLLRNVHSLSGTWKFITDREARGEELGYATSLPAEATEVYVPSLWNNELGLLEYEGVAWYSRRIHTRGGAVRFVFGAVMTEAKVYLDGNLLGEHYGGYTAFDFITEVSEGFHTLAVRVDNRFDADSIPHAKVDWYHYGGIVRDITMEELSGVSVLSCHMVYRLNAKRNTAEVMFKTKLYNASPRKKTAPLSVSLDGEKLWEGSFALAGHESTVVVSEKVKVKNIRLWDVKNPELYELCATTDTDDLYDRVGFREIAVKDGEVCLNGKPIEIRGVCRHEEHADWGFAFPPKLMKRDLDIALDMGCNAIRGSHYPNSRYFVDMLDRAGVMFWSEIPIWGCGYTADDLGNPKVISRGLEMIREMEDQYYNHPSIVIWGVHNEIDSTSQNAYEMTRSYSAELRENGGNRLVTHASNHPLNDICFEFDDIICINHYCGWYGGAMTGWNKTVENILARNAELGFSYKPVIFSEFGAAAIYGNHTFDNVKWSEEYQANLFTYCIELFHRTKGVSGCFVWQFCDMRTSKEMGNDRARSFNNKGILNEYRKPKAGYFAIRELYQAYRKEEEKK